jgi:exopolysaccharide biosynthesis polyprenyl glycosylphosphotransferase
MAQSYVSYTDGRADERPPRVAPPKSSKSIAGLQLSERRFILGLIDVLLLSAALLFALWARTSIFAEMEAVGFFPVRPIWWLTLVLLWLPLSLVFDCYNLKLASDPARSAVFAGGCALVVATAYLVVPVISAPLTRSRLSWFLFAAAAVLLVGGHRIVFARWSRTASLARRVLIVGAGWSGKAMAGEIMGMGDWSGLQLVGFVDDDESLCGGRVMDVPVLGDCHDLVRLVRECGVQDVVVAVTNTDGIRPELMQALIACWSLGVDVVPMPIYYEHLTGAVPTQHLGQNLFSLVGVQAGLGLRLWDVVRRVADVFIGAIGIVLAAVLSPFIALAIVLDSPGRVLYRQERVGLGGRVFTLTKFRSMVQNAEQNGAVWASENDSRITRVGRFLRCTRLDEFPQFWNLINGTMTLIGPRPERPSFVAQLSEAFPYYPVRHSVRPGLTGWAQVRFRYGSTVDDSLQKLRYDLYYLKHRGPVLDAIICLYTLRVIVRMEGS